MRKTLFILVLIALISCEKEKKDEAIPELFKLPLTDWSLTKKQVKEKETRTLVNDTDPSEIVYLAYPWEDKGDGGLKYTDDDFLDEVNYGFYNTNKTLEVVICIYTRTNIRTTDVALEFLNKKYGEYTTTKLKPDFTGFEGYKYQFNAPFGVVVLEEYSSKTNRILFTKSKYASSL
ncbi:MAG TPA: hypothetical protein GXZ87_07005 [Bacteroidales bacterium]|nr:hypothetical protein [Bacteroidales bacterium]